jgi:HEPN domain-containing protein
MPPFIYNLVRIADKARLDFDEETRKSLQELTTFNIKARYEIIKDAFHKRATKSYAQKWLKRTEDILKLLARLA